MADVEVWSDSRLEWMGPLRRRRAGGRGLDGTDGAGEGEMKSGGRDTTSEGDRSRRVGARVDVGLVLVGAAIGVTSVRLDRLGRGLEVAEREGLVVGRKAGFVFRLSNGIGSVGVDTGAGLGFATVGCGGGEVIGLFAEPPQSASLLATGDDHPHVLSLTGDLRPSPFARGGPQSS